MSKVFFYRDTDGSDVVHWVNSLGTAAEQIFQDLVIVGQEGPEFFGACRRVRGDLWELSRRIEPSVDARLIFFFHKKADAYIVLHGFRSRGEGTTRGDVSFAAIRRQEFDC